MNYILDNLTAKQRRKNMQHIKNKDTLIELKLRKKLWNKGYRYRKNVNKLPGKPDIVLSKYKIAIFCDSEFFHGKHLGHDVDDLVVITYRNQSEGKMACQIKHSITATEKDKTFQEVICAAWNDFNKEDFDRDRDRIALVTAQISNKAQQSLRFLHVEAIGAIDAEAFMERIDVPVFSNNDNQKMLVAIKECISLAKGCEPTNEEVWKFCKAFILLLFDMDCAESVNRALSASLIKCNSPENPILVWSRLVEYAGQCNQAAASVSKENIDRNIRDLFSKNNIIQLPPDPITAIDIIERIYD